MSKMRVKIRGKWHDATYFGPVTMRRNVMNEIVDRVAAVFAAEIMELTAEQRRSFRFPDDANGDTCERARSASRAALAAIRVPTAGMLKSGSNFLWFEGRTYEMDDVRSTWQAMIDEALR